MYVQVETERLRIRQISLEDANLMFKLVNTEGWLTFIGDRNIKDISDSRKYIQNLLDKKVYFYNVFELKSTGEPIGIVTLLCRSSYDHPDIGFALLPEYERNGYSFEAAKKYLEEITKTGGIKKVIAITIPGNAGSIRLLQKLGLQFVCHFTENKEELSLYELSIL